MLWMAQKTKEFTLRYFWSCLVYQMGIHYLKMTQYPQKLLLKQIIEDIYIIVNVQFSIIDKVGKHIYLVERT